jgi:hypothetical protein
MTTTTTSPLTATKPRGRNQRERWYQTHARPAEVLYTVILANGSLGRHHGAVGVSTDPAVLLALETRLRHPDAPRWGVAAWTFEEGAKIVRLTMADVASF